jgi:hypothetical protein
MDWQYSTRLTVPNNCNQKLEKELEHTTFTYFCDSEIKIQTDFPKHFCVVEYNIPFTQNTKVWLNDKLLLLPLANSYW